ncbi:Valine-tRNA ligase [Quillaja saponaria]|uniref:Valine-tRNA ligase n=1 Tax=Quillaja saponaria TaxID=32244 RepID=A0AAD7Q0C2_QUISA|nr:Valine-tRNA ligase [Quillaja saponaria]
MSNWHLLNSRVSNIIIVCWIFFSYFPGFILSAVVTLGSIEIFTTHEWIRPTPTVYFNCKEENKTELPDVKKAHVLYTFKGEESWQPLTDFVNKKCKRCGFYEKDSFKSDDVFEEWELCPSDFTAPDGKYTRIKEKEFNATFFCPQCISFASDSHSPSDGHKGRHSLDIALVVLLSVLFTTVLILGVVAGYKYWQKKKREQDQARFLKLFEEGDDIEDELGLGNII